MTEKNEIKKVELREEEKLNINDYQNILGILERAEFKGLKEANYVSALAYKIQRQIETIS
jgi:hypothetical protein